MDPIHLVWMVNQVGRLTDNTHDQDPARLVRVVNLVARLPHTATAIRAELLRLMQVGKRFRACTFTCLEVDTKLDGDLIFAFCETFQRCAR